MESNIIELENVDILTSNRINLLTGITLSIPFGKITVLKARNGVGKTQLMKNILGLQNLNKGFIKRNFKKTDYAYLPQVESVNLTLPLLLGEMACTETKYFSKDLQERPWNLASGGERKRCLLARTFLLDKKLFMLDEPLNHLDKETQMIVSHELIQMCKRGITIIMTGHIDTQIDEELLNIVELEKWKC
ncbi:MAG: ATPase subunit of ABC transporter with duplicated ATPase domains [Bacteriovoracaceae bacterium]|jgi:ATPase subunit of ABC transporter with duplicated ATPase domains